MKQYDLRSDTITLPSREMRKAIARADVGDDVFREDKTVIKVEELAAKITGKKDALFLPSGTMGNLIPLYINGGRGNEILVHEKGHIIHYELSGATAIAGVMPVPCPGTRGILHPDEMSKHLRPNTYYMPKVSMITIENTHNMEGGTCYSQSELKKVCDFAKKHELFTHMDGARIYNASIATDVPVKKLCSYVDTVTFCLSKGLGAPAGSLLCGPVKFIEEARRIRKMLGGGMRQSGILAAAGIYALQNNIERLSHDHSNARYLAEALDAAPWAHIDAKTVETNIIIFTTPRYEAEAVVNTLKRKGILCLPAGDKKVRMVTHLGISREEIDSVCSIIRELKLKSPNQVSKSTSSKNKDL